MNDWDRRAGDGDVVAEERGSGIYAPTMVRAEAQLRVLVTAHII